MGDDQRELLRMMFVKELVGFYFVPRYGSHEEV